MWVIGVHGDVRNREKVNDDADFAELNLRHIAPGGCDAQVWGREESIAADDVLEIVNASCTLVPDPCLAHACMYWSDQEICSHSCGIGDNQEGSCVRIGVDFGERNAVGSCERIAVDFCERNVVDFCERNAVGSCERIVVDSCEKNVEGSGEKIAEDSCFGGESIDEIEKLETCDKISIIRLNSIITGSTRE